VEDITGLDQRKYIVIKGARMHNLRNIDLAIPKNKLLVLTGLSGSGKSSLAFDTLFAEGQRRYVESLSSYARQFLGRMNKPEVDFIRGITPVIAIEQKVNTRNPRSTVGTSTEVYEYLKLLFARIGKTYSPVSGKLVRRHSVRDVADYILGLAAGTRIMIIAPLPVQGKRKAIDQLHILLQQGFSRLLLNGETVRIDDLFASKENESIRELKVIIDRLIIEGSREDLLIRVSDSVQTALYEGRGTCQVIFFDNGKSAVEVFSDRFEADGVNFTEPSVNLFTFNNPFGACKTCEGFGSVIGIDQDLVIPNKSLSVYQDAVVCWKGEKMSEWKDQLVMNSASCNFPIHKPVSELNEREIRLLWEGCEHFRGINDFFRYVEQQTYKIQYRVMLSRYRGKTVCPDCRGTRLRKDAGYVRIMGASISDLVLMQISELKQYFDALSLDANDAKIAERVLKEIHNRLQYLLDVGLGYLTLNRLSNTLSGGESQRINLATTLGSCLVGSTYILDEPSIGLHPRDIHNLIRVLKHLRDAGNTVLVVEHDEEIIRSAEQIIDIGPLAGIFGGELIFQGTFEEILKSDKSYTGKYLSGALTVETTHRAKRACKDYIEVTGARENNLKSVNVRFPLNTLTVVTGVSGSGKTSLVRHVLYPALKRLYGGFAERGGKYDRISGDIHRLTNVEFVEQNPIGRSSRSNPATYVKAYDDIRELFASRQLAKLRGYKPGFFSFNISGGRCDECEGEGTVRIEMQFMADILLTCESCGGKRFKPEVLDIDYRGKNIHEVLSLTVDQAVEFFGAQDKPGTFEQHIINKLRPMQDVGLGYLGLGQPSNTLSGGEAQRIKLSYFLNRGNPETPMMFIFDEPTTGLHFHDIAKLLRAFNELINKGHTIVVIEHNMEIIRAADWIIDLGPEGGERGGQVIYEGPPEGIPACKASYTGQFFKRKINRISNRS